MRILKGLYEYECESLYLVLLYLELSIPAYPSGQIDGQKDPPEKNDKNHRLQTVNLCIRVNSAKSL